MSLVWKPSLTAFSRSPCHDQFFRRHGLEDFLTTILNATFLWRLVLGVDTGPMFRIPEGVLWEHPPEFQREWMMYFYGFAIIGVFGLLALMVWRALRKHKQLELDALEIHLTKASLGHHLISVGVACLSVVILLSGQEPGCIRK